MSDRHACVCVGMQVRQTSKGLFSFEVSCLNIFSGGRGQLCQLKEKKPQ